MTEFPGNSRQARPNTPEITAEPDKTDEPRTRRIVTGDTIRAKRSVGNKLTEMLGDVLGGLVHDVLVPALKDTARDFFHQGVDRALYGGNDDSPRSSRGGGYPSRVGTTVHTPYNQISSRSSNNTTGRRGRQQVDPIDLDDLVLSSAVQCEEIKQEMALVIKNYGVCTVADLNHMLGDLSNPQDHNWGWFDLAGTKVRRERNGYRLILPRVEDVQ